MAKETTSSQSQKDKAPTPPLPGLEDGIARFEALLDQMRSFEQQAIARINEAAEQSAELTRGAVEYMTRLSESWRQLALANARQSAQVFNRAS